MPSSSPSNRGWLPPVLWSLGFLALIGVACVINEELRQVVLEGASYIFVFVTSPFILEATTACIGLAIVMIINSLRIEREGDGWVEMEVRQEPEAPPAEEAKSKGELH
ncbi:MAG: hypothetical protein IPK32_16560 [Verrucomicrobiaceae bacterium]|nr:hypothetical protein [Verrucomicrobiaceae bacterium]